MVWNMSLRLKILIGYVVLISFVAFTINFFRKELIKKNELQTVEKVLYQVHEMAENVYIGLLELASQAETAIVWETEDLAAYRIKRKEVCCMLQELKPLIHTAVGQEHIDSLCLLMEKKEELLDTLMKTFDRVQEIGNIVRREIPTIVSSVQNTTTSIKTSNYSDTERTTPKTNFWSRIFKKKEKQSAYLEQREKTKNTSNQKQSNVIPTVMLYSLNKEVTNFQKTEEKRLLFQMDHLYRNNTDLNRKLYRIIREVEKETNYRLEEHYQRFTSQRNRTFYQISVLAIFISLLAFFQYIIIHSELKRKHKYQRDLEASDKANRSLLQSKKDMMLTIAHDLRSPLGTISGSAELLSDEKRGKQRAGYIDNIQHASEYMLSLVDTLMEFYLLDTGQIQSHPSIFNLVCVFRETSESYLPMTQKKGLSFSIHPSGLDTVVYGDKGYLQQIINNLLSNAVKYTVQGSIRIEAEYRKGELYFSIRDTGTGMDESETKRIFTAFERLENARGISGSGLGLVICSRLVSQMGGSIRVESRKGEGSNFIVLLPLPLADEKSPLDTEKLSPDFHVEGIRILLLDDDIRQLGIVKEMLSRHRAICDCCQDSSELVARLRGNEYDILLMDIQMPETDGFAVLELLRSSNIPQARAIPAIALTARMDDDNGYLSRGFAGCIRKPFTMESLTEGVAKVVGKMKDEERGPDFSLLLVGEDNRREMLEVFITESRKDLSGLHKALEKDDRQAVCDILHKNLPLWDAVRLDFPIEELRRITTTPPFSWTAEDLARIHEIEGAADRLLSYAINMQKEEE